MGNILAGIISIVIGLLGCFYGYAIFRILLPFLGGIMGYIVGLAVAGPDHRLIGIILGLVIAVLFSGLAYFAWGAFVAFGGAMLGLAAGFLLGKALLLPNLFSLIIGLGFAVALGAFFFRFKDLAVMFNSAFSGAGTALYGISLLVPSMLGFLHDRRNVITAILWLVLALVGAAFQYGIFSGQRRYGDEFEGTERRAAF